MHVGFVFFFLFFFLFLCFWFRSGYGAVHPHHSLFPAGRESAVLSRVGIVVPHVPVSFIRTHFMFLDLRILLSLVLPPPPQLPCIVITIHPSPSPSSTTRTVGLAIHAVVAICVPLDLIPIIVYTRASMRFLIVGRC